MAGGWGGGVGGWGGGWGVGVMTVGFVTNSKSPLASLTGGHHVNGHMFGSNPYLSVNGPEAVLHVLSAYWNSSG